MKRNSKYSLLKIVFIGIIIQLTALCFSFGQTKTEKLEDLINLYTDYGQFNGSVLIAEKGKVVFKRGFGMANMEWDIPNQPDTKHRLGSITKQFTSMLIIQLVENGKLKLDVPITTYLPDYPKSKGEKITLHHLLTHSSGIPSYTSFPNFFNNDSRDPYSPEEFVKVFADSTLEFTPGEKFAYSNSGYFLLGVIIEKVTGKSYEQVLHENILTPLKMNNTGFDHHGTILKNRATGYEKNGSEYINAPYLDMSIPYAAGSLYSTVEDLYLWDQALYTNKLLSKEYMDLIFTTHIAAMGMYYAYGWIISNIAVEGINDSLLVISHGGGINGFNTLISRIPSDKNLVVLFNNTGGAALNDMNIAITSILYGTAYNMPKKSLANLLLEIILKKGISSGLEQFKELKNSEIYSLKENEMNSVGYRLLQLGKVKESIEVFKLNTEAFPESGNTFDSLGEAYLEDGNKELAIKFYKKSVELDPENTNAISILKRLESE
jgi:CubicO group peptidase (beta-lactamase class C family)